MPRSGERKRIVIHPVLRRSAEQRADGLFLRHHPVAVHLGRDNRAGYQPPRLDRQVAAHAVAAGIGRERLCVDGQRGAAGHRFLPVDQHKRPAGSGNRPRRRTGGGAGGEQRRSERAQGEQGGAVHHGSHAAMASMIGN